MKTLRAMVCVFGLLFDLLMAVITNRPPFVRELPLLFLCCAALLFVSLVIQHTLSPQEVDRGS